MPIAHHYSHAQETLSNYEGRDKQIIQCPKCSLVSISEGGSGRYITWPQSSALDIDISTPVYHSQQHRLLWVFAFAEGFSVCLFGQVTWGYSLNIARLFQSLKHPSIQAIRRCCFSNPQKHLTFKTVGRSYYWYINSLRLVVVLRLIK